MASQSSASLITNFDILNGNDFQTLVSRPGQNGEPWPAGISREPIYSIGKVVALVKSEFPTLTVSKLRYLEDQNIVTPLRTDSGYRKYSKADVVRIRYCLSMQRDSYLPIRAIREQLQSLDAGETIESVAPARLIASDGELVTSADSNEGRITIREVMDLTGASRQELDKLASVGLLRPDLSGRVSARSHQVVRLAAALQDCGVAPTQLRFLVTSAQRATDALDRAAEQRINTKTAAGKHRKQAQVQENSEYTAQLFTQLVRIFAQETL